MSQDDISTNIESTISTTEKSHTSTENPESLHESPRLKENNGELTVKDYWLSRRGRRTKTVSESESSDSSLSSWLPDLAFGRPRANSESEGKCSAPRSRSNTWGAEAKSVLVPLLRAASSKDVEEAMAGGLNKTQIFMPPM